MFACVCVCRVACSRVNPPFAEVGAGSGEEEQAGEADDANALFALRHALSHDPLVQVGEGEAAPEGALPGQFRRPKKEPRKRWDP